MTRLDLALLDRKPGASAALSALWAVLPEARLVGGVVRDLIAGHPVADLDLGTPEPPQTVIARLADAGIRSIATGLSHGTVTALIDGQPVEITTLRRDEQTDGRHARVAWTVDWREDAQRRDFTINAMSASRSGALFDYFGGLDDLKAGRVRFVGDPAARIAEDALRILRFFRFQARYGLPGQPDAAAMTAIASSLAGLQRLSAERVWSELRRILAGPSLAATLSLMHGLGVLDALLPGGVDPARPALVPDDPVLRLAALIRGPPGTVAESLRLSNDEAGRLRALLAAPAPGGAPGTALDDAELRRLLADDPADLLCGRAWLAQSLGGDAEAWQQLRRRLAAIPRPVFPLAGRDVLACGVAPGPEVGRLLAQTRDWWRAGGCVAGSHDCLARLRALAGIPPDAPGC